MTESVLRRFDLEGRVALVTGSAQGLGRAIAEALASVGASVVVTSRALERAEDAANEIASRYSKSCAAMTLDVRVAASVEATMSEIDRRLGRLDILVNSAGITHRGSIESLLENEWDAVLDTNLKGAWLCSRAAGPRMRAGGWGRILNVSSMFCKVALPDRSPYIASKGGMDALTRALAVELAEDRILVNALAPGPFQTQLADAGARARLLADIPLGRWGQPAELGPAAVFLCSEAASFITGATLSIDGGYSAR